MPKTFETLSLQDAKRAVGTSAGTGQTDIEVAEAAIGAIEPFFHSASVGIA